MIRYTEHRALTRGRDLHFTQNKKEASMSSTLSSRLSSKVRIVLATFLLSIASGSFAQSVTIGVSIPSATHGWAGGLNFHAEQSKARLEAKNSDLKIVLVTANSASEQANDLEDLVAIHNPW